MAECLKILVADDAQLFRHMLEAGLAHRFDILPGAATLGEVDAAFARGTIDVALIDLAWKSEGSCLPRMKHWLSLQPNCRLVMITGYEEWFLAEKCLGHGATGFAVKSDSIADLDRAITMAARGERYISDKLVRVPATGRRSTHRTLSRPARHVLQLLAEGFTQKEIAMTLGLKVRTVEDHVRAIKEYFGVPTRAKPNWPVFAAGVVDRTG